MNWLPDLLGRGTALYPDRPAVVETGSGAILTYAALTRAVDYLVADLQSRGVIRNSHVAVAGANSAAFVTAYFAVLRLGAVVVPLLTGRVERDFRAAAATCNLAFALFADPEDIPLGLGDRAGVVTTEQGFSLARFPGADPGARAPDAVAVMLRTSGSTSVPKVVMLSHGALLHSAEAHAQSVGYGNGERGLVALPLAFSFAHTSQMLALLLSGGTLYLMPPGAFHAGRYLRLAAEHAVHSTALVAVHLRMWLDACGVRVPPLPDMRHVCYAGGPTPESIPRTLYGRYPHIKFLQAYGLTEAGPRVTVVRPDEAEWPTRSAGRPVPGVTVIIRDAADHPLPLGEPGEITVRGPSLMTGYYQAPDQTAQALRDGWLYTGDLGVLSAGGSLTLVGRHKNIIITMGMNVAPEEVEECLTGHEAVSEALVRGKPDSLTGEVVTAQVVLRPGYEGMDPAELLRHCRTSLAPYKVPREVAIVTALPRTENGKLLRVPHPAV